MFNLSKKQFSISITLIFTLLMLFSCTNAKKGKLIEPLYMPIDMNNIQEGIYRIDLKSSDIIEENGETYFTPNIYSEDIYDTIDLHNIKVGDRILRHGKEELVESVHWDKDESCLCINFPSFEDAEEEYRPSDSGGTYYVVGPSDHHSYTFRGKTKILVDKNLIMKDTSRLDMPEQNIPLKNIKSHIEKGYTDEFNFLSTYMRVENGKVVELTHHYIP